MPYGTIKVDTITFTAGGVDTSVSISGLVQNPTFTGNITSTGTISGNIIRGGTTVSGATVTGTTANFTSGNFTSISGGTYTITSGVFASGTAAAPSITFTGDLDTGIFNSAANQFSITTSGTEWLRVDGTGQIEAVSLGSAAAPTFSFTTDPNTGIYSPGADQLAISTGGSGRLFINSNGDIGLGTNSPDVFGRFYTRTIGLSSSGSTAIQINSATGSSAIIDLGVNAARTAGITSNINETTIATLTATPLVFQTNGGERLRITSAGLVGVGNSSPGSYNASSDDLVVGDHVGAHGVTICSQNNSSGYIMFADGTTGAQTYAGQITYDHTNNLLTLGTNDGTTGLTIDSSQRVGIGTTSPISLLEVKSAASADCKQTVSVTTATQSAFTSFVNTTVSTVGTENSAGGNLVAGSSAYATILSNNGAYPIQFGTNNTVRATLDSSGRLGIGTSSPSAKLHVAGALDGDDVIRADANSSNGLIILRPDGANGNQIRFGGNGANANILRFVSGGDAERARIDSSGRLLVGTSSTSSNTTLLLQGYNGTQTDAGGHLRLAIPTATPANGANLGVVLFSDSEHTNCAYISGDRDGGTWSASSKPTRLVFSTTADGASSPTERMRITNDGTIFFGKTTNDFTTEGVQIRQGNATTGFVTGGGTVITFSRTTNDGTIVSLRQDGIEEGSISVSGTTVSYNGAHLSRWSQLSAGAERIEILRGTVLSNLDEMCEWTDEDNEQLNRMKVSDVEGDKNVSGVFQCWDDDDDTYINDFYCAMTGDFIIRIAGDVTVERGDLLMSAGDGTAKPQDDDIIRSKTIAKVTSTNVSCTYDDGSYCVPCVLMAC